MIQNVSLDHITWWTIWLSYTMVWFMAPLLIFGLYRKHSSKNRNVVTWIEGGTNYMNTRHFSPVFRSEHWHSDHFKKILYWTCSVFGSPLYTKQCIVMSHQNRCLVSQQNGHKLSCHNKEVCIRDYDVNVSSVNTQVGQSYGTNWIAVTTIACDDQDYKSHQLKKQIKIIVSFHKQDRFTTCFKNFA